MLRSRCCTVSDDTQTGLPCRCVAVTTISRQAEICVLYTDVIEPLPQNCIIIPSECDRSTLSREPVPTPARDARRIALGTDVSSRKRLSYIIVLATPTFPRPPTTSPLNQKHTHIHTHIHLFFRPFLFLRRTPKIEFRVGGKTVYKNNI